MIPMELRQIFDRTEDPIALEEVPDAFTKFLADAELAGVAGGFSHVAAFRTETANVNERAAGIYKAIAAAEVKAETKRLAKGAPLKLFVPLVKIDEEKRLVFGVAASETPDRQNEILDYEGSKPYFRAWSESVCKDSGGVSLGNVREMHQLSAVGTVKDIEFNDSEKRIEICVKVADDGAWKKVVERVYTGFSIGGKYAKTWQDAKLTKLTRYIADPSEISFVDRPAVPDAVFEMVKAGQAA